MKLSEKIVKNHTQSDKLHKKRDNYSLNNFINKLNLSRDLNREIENNIKDNKLKVQSRENLIINSVTALEVFIKDSIKGDLYYFAPEKQKNLLKEKISLYEAYELFRKTKIETEDIIAGYYNFQNLDSISYVLGVLTGRDFFKCINDIKTELSPDLVNYFKLDTLNLSCDFPN
ncbi:hypothetical protein CXF68_09705 [Tenacibaculum sp. Bg11-29]|uniref:hypothetical protein n=1 Tax=Tenacibaculum sp. Bg11-29 TaxID=2058306 RepID=UPI000C32E3CF|nr:hypothetical protein [Tenacibaculum sp. Bg11-29]PKH50941.1 hypothetical protein CXF68_09705 [Tenacibaculum sp. Bg11-29]